MVIMVCMKLVKIGKVVSNVPQAGFIFIYSPPLVSRELEGLNNIKLHKIFANIHVPAMIITNVYSDKQHDANKYREIHSSLTQHLQVILLL